MSIMVTGGCGFIGTNFITDWLAQKNELLVNIDSLSYASNIQTSQICNEHYDFICADLNDTDLLTSAIKKFRPRAIIHFAAETHVDNSILAPDAFIATNINGTYSLLCAARDYWSSTAPTEQQEFVFLNISTDEVYGQLGENDEPFTESSPMLPNSPYSASKAAADHIVRAFEKTYGLPTITTRCTNNFGPWQHSEKLIPKILTCITEGKPIPIYGDGQQIRDWIYVMDHVGAINTILEHPVKSKLWNIGSSNEISNLELVKVVCNQYDLLTKNNKRDSFKRLAMFVHDRPGHDFRYGINPTKLYTETSWRPKYRFNEAIVETILWYLSTPRQYNGKPKRLGESHG